MTVSRLQPYAITVFAEMSALAARIGAVNLGQGFPDEDGPPAMLKTAENAIAEGVNQYPPGLGIAPLREAIAAQRKRHFGTEYDPDTEVLVTVGATEAIAAAVIGLVEPGSEVLLIEPFYDSYSPVIAMAGAQRVAVPLVPDGGGFAIDVDGLRRAITPRTKALIVNSPHNPTGMVASDEELGAGGPRRLGRPGDRRRGLRAPGVRRPPPPPAGELSGNGRADDHHLQCGEDVQLHRLEDRMGLRGTGTHRRCARGQAVPVLRRRRAVPARGGAGTQHRGGVGGRLRESLQAKRDRLGSALAELGFEVHDSSGTYFLCADPRPLGYTDSTRVLRRAARTRRRGGHPDVGVLRSGRRARRRVESLGALRILQARRHARRGDPAVSRAAED